MGNVWARQFNYGSYDGWEPWHRMHGGDLKHLRKLLAIHGDSWVAHADEYNVMLIHAAARSGDRERVEFLLERGSPHSPRSLWGTPAQYAEEAGHAELAAWLHATQPAILFLDIDGVLNSQASRRAGDDALEQGEMRPFETQLPTEEALALLADVARAAGPLQIVLSSTWRCKPDTRAAVVESLRTVGLSLAGDTPDFEAQCRGDRVDEIIESLRQQCGCGWDTLPWVVLDDLDLMAMNPKLDGASFVRTDDAVGLTRAKADEAIAKLQAQRDVLRLAEADLARVQDAHPWLSPWCGPARRNRPDTETSRNEHTNTGD